MKQIFSWIDAKQRRDGLIMFSVLAIVNLIDFFTFWSWLNGVIAVFSAVLVAVLYEGGKLSTTEEENDGQRG